MNFNLIVKRIFKGIFPHNWKETTIIPVEKVTGFIKCEDFRPINMFLLYEKILEKRVSLQMMNDVEDNNILILDQLTICLSKNSLV